MGDMTDKKAIAVYSDTAYSGVVIFDINDDYVENAVFTGKTYGRVAQTKLKYAADGRPYFMKMGRRFYIDNFTKC